MRRSSRALLIASALLALGGCDQLGIESASVVAARREADGKAIGGACRHAGRAIEDCYVLNRKAERAAIYAGWREMNEYMRENKLEPVIPQIEPEARVAARVPQGDEATPAHDAGADSRADKPAAKAADKARAHAAEPMADKAADPQGDKPPAAPPRRRAPP